jgi:hypothetical protein
VFLNVCLFIFEFFIDLINTAGMTVLKVSMLCCICTLTSSGSSRFLNGVINRIGKIVKVYFGVYCCTFMAVIQPVLTLAEFEDSHKSLLFI